MLSRMGMRSLENKEDTIEDSANESPTPSNSSLSSTHNNMHSGRDESDEEVSVARTATSSSIIELLSGITNRVQYEVRLILSLLFESISNFTAFNLFLFSCDQHLSSIEMGRTHSVGSINSNTTSNSPARSFVEYFDAEYMRPTFGGP